MFNTPQQQRAYDAFIAEFADMLRAAIEESKNLEPEGSIGHTTGSIAQGIFRCVYTYYPTNQLDIQFGRTGAIKGTEPDYTLHADTVNQKWVDKFDHGKRYSNAELIALMIGQLKEIAESRIGFIRVSGPGVIHP